MSIARIAQSKFGFQDLVCIDLAFQLGLCGSRPGSLIVEPDDGEDAELVLHNSGAAQRIEVQIKEDQTPVTLKTITNYLLHFPERKDAECLLERVLDDPIRSVLFVLHGRCDDDSSRYVAPTTWSGALKRRAVPLKAVGRLRESLFEIAGVRDGTTLKRKRNEHIRKLLERLTAKQLQTSVNRILIKERVDVADVLDSCGRYLREQLIPVDEVPNVLQKLRGAIEDSKKTRADVIPLLRTIIKTAAPASIAPILYVQRGDECTWRRRLSDSGVLLLSGRSRCGKSEAGRHIASEYQLQGFKVKQGSAVDDAARYLLEPTEDHRLFLLHDPLGSLTAAEQSYQVIDTLRYILLHVSPSRKLIVSQNQDRLFEYFRTSQIEECAINGHAWFDLSASAPSFLASVWQALAARTQVSTSVRTKVGNALRIGKLDLEVGCIRHLAFSSSELSSSATIAQIEKKAREDARDLGFALASEGSAMQQTLVALAIASTPHQPVHFNELCYILDPERRELPGLKRWKVTAKGDLEEPKFPKYKRSARLNPEHQRCLDRLQSRGFLKRENDECRLEHPFYQAAASATVERLDPTSRDVAVRILRRAVFSLSRATSLMACRHMGLLLAALNSIAHEHKLAHIAIRALSSIFPATRDACLRFLIENFDRLPPDRITSLFGLVGSVARTSLTDVAWHRGEAWIPSSRPLNFERLFPRPVERAAVEKEILALDGSGSDAPTAERACSALRYLHLSPKEMTSRMALRLLSYDESLIRAKTAELWLSVDRKSDVEILERIFVDPHPAILLSVVQTLVWHWNHLADQRRRLLLRRLRSKQLSAISALPLLDWLGRFDRIEETGKNPPWIVFGEILPNIISALPTSAQISDVHLFNSVQVGAAQLSAPSIQNICQEWAAYLERCADSRILTDYELGITQIAIDNVPAGAKRVRLMERLLSIHGTPAKMLVLRDLVDRWSNLSDPERKLVLQLLALPAADQCWLKAAVATARTTPGEAQKLVYGDLDAQTFAPVELLEQLDSQLTECLATIYVRPGVIHFIGLSCQSSSLNRIFESLEHMPTHPLFEVMLSKAIDAMSDSRVQAAVRACDAEHLNRVFNVMLRKKVHWNGNWLPRSWSELLTSADEQTKSLWYDRMAEASPAICDHLSDIRLWLANPPDREQLYVRLPVDTLLITAAWKTLRSNDGRPDVTSVSKFAAFLRAILRDFKPKLYGTYDELVELVKVLGIEDSSLLRKLTSGRKSALERRHKVEDSFREPRITLQSWDGLQ